MKSVFIAAFVLALAKLSFAIQVCNQDVPDTSTLTISCQDDKNLKYPNYNDLTTYFICASNGQAQLQKCPANQYFCYYRQNCGPCSNFLVPPDCEFFSERTNSKCSNKVTTKAPITTKAPTSTKTSTTTKAPITTKAPTTKNPATTPSSIPTPPSQSTPSSGVPMPPMVVTPVPGIPTPPNENVTPPSIPGTPPMLTTVQSI